jgi:signal transduction histidine kinase
MGSAKYLQSIAQTVTPEGIEEMTNDILVSARRLIRITENFLTYAQIESFMADPAMRATVRSFRTDEPAAMLYDLGMAKAMNFDRAEDVVLGDLIEGLTIEVSSENFAKIIAELTDNALRFSESGTSVTLDMFEGPYGFVGFKIADNGRGMTADQITDIGAYKQFERTTYEQQGVGLGLYIAKKLTELHNGIFTIESTEGVGTTITFTLPVVMGE